MAVKKIDKTALNLREKQFLLQLESVEMKAWMSPQSLLLIKPLLQQLDKVVKKRMLLLQPLQPPQQQLLLKEQKSQPKVQRVVPPLVKWDQKPLLPLRQPQLLKTPQLKVVNQQQRVELRVQLR